MDYFASHYPLVRYPFATDASPGLRRAQAGAIHAIAAYFTHHTTSAPLDPATIVMPTGSGKTAVLMLSAFVLKARRVLVITPSRLVRAQVSREFQTLSQLTSIGALEGNIPGPKVHLLDNKLTSPEEWSRLSAYDVVVSTPNCTSPGYKDIASPPPDLFDLLLIDEAHHQPAKTWKAILEAFPRARVILFTATPFRQDRREVKGSIVYEFSIREAYEDRIFGEIKFLPVCITDETTPDEAIAKQARAVLEEDRRENLDHYLLVRTNTKKHAKELLRLYQRTTGLNLRLIHSGHTPKYVDQMVELLRRKKLDGLVCVDMLGEGFDFPNLKIAAIHAPHKTFPVTLQFIGRFARTGTQRIGQAKFLAIPQNILLDTDQLYKQGKIWQEIVPDLYQARIEREIRVKKELASFESAADVGTPEEDIKDISLYSLTPYHHVKIYRLGAGADLQASVMLGRVEILRREYSESLSTLVLLTREEELPEWSTSRALAGVEYHLILAYYDQDTGLLFLNSSSRVESLYKDLASQLSTGRYEPLPMCEINRVLTGMEAPEFFNLGLRNRLLNSQTESYRIIAGPNVQRAISRSDGRLFHRGHIFGRGGSETERLTIGYSSASKVWSNKTASIPELVEWCRALAGRIASAGPVITGSGLDAIPVGERIESLPEDIWTVDWGGEVYRNPPRIRYVLDDDFYYGQLLDLDLRIDRTASQAGSLRVKVSGPELEWKADYSPARYPFFTEAADNLVQPALIRSSGEVSLVDFLNEHPLNIYTADQSLIAGNEIFRADMSFSPLSPDRIEAVNWKDKDVDIGREFGASKRPGCRSIHDYLKERLCNSEAELVFYDHGSGEIADFVTFQQLTQGLLVALYHVKGSSKAGVGDRVGDVYEVSGQAVKSLIWLTHKDRLLNRILYRGDRAHPFVKPEKGGHAQIESWLAGPRVFLQQAEIAIVQPGISKASMLEKIANVLASADDYIVRCGCTRLRVIASG